MFVSSRILIFSVQSLKNPKFRSSEKKDKGFFIFNAPFYIFLLLHISEVPSLSKSLVLSFIDYEQAYDSVDRRALAKVLSLYGIPEKYIKVIYAMYENNTAAVKVGNEVSNWFCIKSGVEQSCVLSPFIRIILMGFVLRSTGKAIGDHGIKWGGKTLLDLNYANDLSILDESVSKKND